MPERCIKMVSLCSLIAVSTNDLLYLVVLIFCCSNQLFDLLLLLNFRWRGWIGSLRVWSVFFKVSSMYSWAADTWSIPLVLLAVLLICCSFLKSWACMFSQNSKSCYLLLRWSEFWFGYCCSGKTGQRGKVSVFHPDIYSLVREQFINQF